MFKFFVLFAASCAAVAQADMAAFLQSHTAFDVPFCGDIWDAQAPPAVADATVISTVAFLDSVGYFANAKTDSSGSPVLGWTPGNTGTVPWDVYLQVAMAHSFGALDPVGPSPAQQQCLATFQAASQRDVFSPLGSMFESDIVAISAKHGNEGELSLIPTMEYYLNSVNFFERRLCPCYNMMPRALFENMNCNPTREDGSYSLSQSYLLCQTDITPFYEQGGPYDYELASEMPRNSDLGKVNAWEGLLRPDSPPFAPLQRAKCISEECTRHSMMRDAAQSAFVVALNLVPSVAPRCLFSTSGKLASKSSPDFRYEWLDDTAGSAMPCTSVAEAEAIFAAWTKYGYTEDSNGFASLGLGSPSGFSLARIVETCTTNVFLSDGTCSECTFAYDAMSKVNGNGNGKGKKAKGKKAKEPKSMKESKSPKGTKGPKSPKGPGKGKTAALKAKQSQAKLEVGAGVALVGMVAFVALVATKMARPSSTETDYILPPVEV